MRGGTLRLVVVGCGRVFERYHLPALRTGAAPDDPGVALVAACESDPRRRDVVQSMLGVPCHAALDDLLQAGGADAALVATPPGTHVQIAAALMEAGMHVLVEKPMATSVADAVRLQGTQRRSGRVLRVGFNRRYRAAYDRLRSRVLEGGAPREVSFTFVAESARWNGGGRDPAAAAEFVLHDAGSHALDLIAHVAGTPVQSVRATPLATPGGTVIEIDARLAGGTVGRCVVGQAPRYREALAATDARGRSVRVDASGHSAATRAAIKLDLVGRRLTGRPSPSEGSFRAQMRAFLAACRGEEDERGADAGDGVASAAAVEASLRSLEESSAWCDVGTAETTSRSTP